MNSKARELRIDFHVHTSRSSDAVNPVSLLTKVARWRDLDGVALTDHDSFDPDRLERLRDQTDLLLIPGQEITTRIGHLLAYFIDSPVPPGADAGDTLERIHAQGGLAVLAHPYRSRMSYPSDLLKRFDAVELHNARSGSPGDPDTPNYHTRRTFEDHTLPGLGGSDAHFPWEVGRARTVLSCAPTPSDVRSAILRGEVRAEGSESSSWNRWWSRRVHAWRS